MPNAVRVLPRHRLGLVRFAGHVDGDAICAAFRRLLLDAAWEPDFRLVWDVRRVRALDLVPEDIPRISEVSGGAFRPRLGPGRSAVLARDEQDEITVKLLRLRGDRDPGRELRPFRSAAEAAAWLGAPVELVDAA